MSASTQEVLWLQSLWDDPTLDGQPLTDWHTIRTKHLGGDDPSLSMLLAAYRVNIVKFEQSITSILREPRPDTATLTANADETLRRSASLLQGLKSLQLTRDPGTIQIEAFHQLEQGARYLKWMLETKEASDAKNHKVDKYSRREDRRLIQGLVKAASEHATCLITNAGLTETEEWTEWSNKAKAWRRQASDVDE
ncbi:hypothetical protein BD324DRAFT_651779 [Kockovaella imperatae]|uniref:Uncharacterized protein n=1 Tax=Kockovaella imperatae TaxID=4999 RepID=A0A1Y1UCW8_9TREE|nr:hypothetical protein BD324DRAFT_651779 [Kockovaella imperatae]ORX35863.1 hypothetical protein BD324DRAFT_651779 [Kockovaella imperatae]